MNNMKPCLFFPSNDTMVDWMVPILEKLPMDFQFIVFPTRGEKANSALNRYEVPYREYAPGLIQEIDPSICIFGNDWGMEELFSIIEAKLLNIPTLGIQEGVILNLRGSNLVSNDDPTYVQDKYLNTDYFFCLGKVFLPSLMRKNLMITGNPKFDAYKKLPFPDKQRILINCNFPYGVDEEHRQPWINDVVRACEELNLDYFVSVHPRDFGKIDVDENKIIKSSSATIRDQIASATMVISRASTIIYEAIAAGRKVVYYNPGIEALPIINDFPKSTLIKASTLEDLLRAISISSSSLDIENEDYMAFRESHLGTLNQNSADLCAHGILSIINGNFVPESSFLPARKLNDIVDSFIVAATFSINNLINLNWFRSQFNV